MFACPCVEFLANIHVRLAIFQHLSAIHDLRFSGVRRIVILSLSRNHSLCVHLFKNKLCRLTFLFFFQMVYKFCFGSPTLKPKGESLLKDFVSIRLVWISNDVSWSQPLTDATVLITSLRGFFTIYSAFKVDWMLFYK